MKTVQRLLKAMLCLALAAILTLPPGFQAWALAPKSQIQDLDAATVAAHFMEIADDDPNPVVYTKNGKIIGRARQMERETLLKIYERHGPFYVHNRRVSRTGFLSLGLTGHPKLVQKFHFAGLEGSKASALIGENAVATEIFLTPAGTSEIVRVSPALMVKDGHVLSSSIDVRRSRLKKLHEAYGTFELTRIFVSKNGEKSDLDFGGDRYNFGNFPGAEATAIIGENGFPTRIRLKPTTGGPEIVDDLYCLTQKGHLIGSAREITDKLLEKTYEEYGLFWVDKHHVPPEGTVSLGSEVFNFRRKKSYIGAEIHFQIGPGGKAVQARYKVRGSSAWSTRNFTQYARQKLKWKNFVHVEGFEKPVLQLSQPEKNLITVGVRRIFELGRWVPDKISFPKHAVNAGRRFDLKRVYGKNGKLLRVAGRLDPALFEPGGLVSTRASPTGNVYLSGEHQYKLPAKFKGKHVHAVLGPNGIPVKLIVNPGTTDETIIPLTLFVQVQPGKRNRLLGSALRVRSDVLADLYQKHGTFQVWTKTDKHGALNLGAKDRLFRFSVWANARARVNIGSNGYATRVALRKRGQKDWTPFEPLLLTKNPTAPSPLLGSSMAFATKTLRKIFGVHGDFWITGLRVKPSGMLHIAGEHFPFSDHAGQMALTRMGANAVPIEVNILDDKFGIAGIYPLVTVEKNGKPIRAFRSAAGFDPKRYAPATLKYVPVPDHGVVAVAGDLFVLPAYAETFEKKYYVNISYDAEGRAQSVEVVTATREPVAKLAAAQVLHKQIADWGQWTPHMRKMFDKYFGLAIHLVGTYVPRNSPHYADALEEGITRGLCTAVQRNTGTGDTMPASFLAGHVRRAVMEYLSQAKLESPWEAEFLADISSPQREDELTAVEHGHTQREIQRALSELDTLQRAVITMRYFENKTLEDIMRELHLEGARVRQLHDEGMVILRNLLPLLSPDNPGDSPTLDYAEQHAGMHPEQGRPTPREIEIGRRTRFDTFMLRLERLDAFLFSQRFQNTYRIAWSEGGNASAEIGPGFPPETIRRFARRAWVGTGGISSKNNTFLAVDTEIPSHVLVLNPKSVLQNPANPDADQTFVLFDEKGDVMDAAFQRRSLRYAMQDRLAEYKKFTVAVCAARQMMSVQGKRYMLGMEFFSFEQEYGMSNLRFAIGSMSSLPVPDRSLCFVRALNEFVHYRRDEQRAALSHIGRKLQEGGVFVEGSLESHRGDFVIYQKDLKKMIPREILFLNWERISDYLREIGDPVHRPLSFSKQQQHALRWAMGYMKKLSLKPGRSPAHLMQSLARQLNKIGFVAEFLPEGNALSLALGPDMSPAMQGNVTGPLEAVGLPGPLEQSALAPQTLFSPRKKQIPEDDFCDRVSARIARHKAPAPYCIGLGGGAGAGKTTYSKTLQKHLERRGHKVLVIGMDSFFAGPEQRAELLAQGDEWGRAWVRVAEMRRVMQRIRAGDRIVQTQRFVRKPGEGIERLEPWTISLEGYDAVLFEGLWALSPSKELGGLLDFMDTTVYMDARTPDMRRWRWQREKEKGPLARSPDAFARHWNLGILPDLRNNIRPSRVHADFILNMGPFRSMKFSLGPRTRRKTALRVSGAWPPQYVHAKITQAFTRTGRFQIVDNGGATTISGTDAFGKADGQRDLANLCREAKNVVAGDSDYRLLHDAEGPFTRYLLEARVVGIEGLPYDEEYGVAGDASVLSLHVPWDMLEYWLDAYRSKDKRLRRDAVLELASALFDQITEAMLIKKFGWQKREAKNRARLAIEKNLFVRKRLVSEKLAIDLRAAKGRLAKELGLRARIAHAKTFADRLQIALAARKLRTADNLAAAMQIPARKVLRWLDGKGSPTPPMLAKLATVLKIPEDLLRYGRPRHQAELEMQDQRHLEFLIRRMPREKDWKMQLPAVTELAMRQMGVSVQTIASFTGVTRTTVRSWLRCEAYPGPRHRPLLAQALKIPRNSVELLMFARDLEEELYDDTRPGSRVQKARLARGLTLRQLAALAGIKHYQQLIHWEEGRENIPHAKYKPLAVALKVPQWLLQSHKTPSERMRASPDTEQKAQALLLSAA